MVPPDRAGRRPAPRDAPRWPPQPGARRGAAQGEDGRGERLGQDGGRGEAGEEGGRRGCEAQQVVGSGGDRRGGAVDQHHRRQPGVAGRRHGDQAVARIGREADQHEGLPRLHGTELEVERRALDQRGVGAEQPELVVQQQRHRAAGPEAGDMDARRGLQRGGGRRLAPRPGWRPAPRRSAPRPRGSRPGRHRKAPGWE